jgi:hypothetical protein
MLLALLGYPSAMPLPAQIPVKYSEEEAEYLSVRPVVRQTFQIFELVDMVLGVTGKDAARVQQILRTGTLVFNFYRYWWTGFDADVQELAALLAKFPDADPARPFRSEECTVAMFVGKSAPQIFGALTLPANGVEITRAEAARKRLLKSKSFWDALLSLAHDEALGSAPVYLGYSYQRRADVYQLELVPPQALALAQAAEKLAPRSLRASVPQIAAAARLLFLCPRVSSTL